MANQRFEEFFNKRRFSNTMWIWVFMIGSFASAQGQNEPAFRYHIPVNIHIGASLARMSGNSGTGITTRPGLSLSLASGIMARYKNAVGLALEGGFLLNGYTYEVSAPSVIESYDVANFGFSCRGRIFGLIPIKNNRYSSLYLALNGGYYFVGDGTLINQKSVATFVTSSTNRVVSFIEPEIGLAKLMKKSQFDLGLTYHINLAPSNLMSTRVITSNYSATGNTRLNYLGLVVRIQPEFNRDRKPRVKPEPKVKPEKSRKQEIVRAPSNPDYTLEVKIKPNREANHFDLGKEVVLIEVWDNSSIDGDTISVYFNGEPVLLNYGLQAKKERIELKLKPGKNELTVVAVNEGSIRPNTAAFTLRCGRKRYTMNTITSKTQNETIHLNYTP